MHPECGIGGSDIPSMVVVISSCVDPSSGGDCSIRSARTIAVGWFTRPAEVAAPFPSTRAARAADAAAARVGGGGRGGGATGCERERASASGVAIKRPANQEGVAEVWLDYADYYWASKRAGPGESLR